MTFSGYICTIWCEAECRHGIPCEMPRPTEEKPHPTRRGHPSHFGYDHKTGLMHEWEGKRGKCRTAELPFDEDRDDDAD